MTNLMDLVSKDNEILDIYLEDTTTDQIKSDIIYTVSVNTPKEALDTLINTLIKIRDDN